MSTKTGITNITGSEASLSLEERFSALGSVVGKLSKCIDDRNAYVRLLDEKLTELKIYAGLPKNATYEELSAKIKVSQQDLRQYSQFYSSLVKILDLNEKADFDTVLELAIESYDVYNQMTASITLDQLSTKIDANAKLLKNILELHSASTSDEIKNDGTKAKEKVADYNINMLLRRPNYATVLGSGLLSGLVCAGIGLLMWYKAPDPDEVHVHQRRAAESEIASTERALETLFNNGKGNLPPKEGNYFFDKWKPVLENLKSISPKQPAVAVGSMFPPTDSIKDTIPPKMSSNSPKKANRAKVNGLTLSAKKNKISSCGAPEANHSESIGDEVWKTFYCMSPTSGGNCLNASEYVPKETDTTKYVGCSGSNKCCKPKQ